MTDLAALYIAPPEVQDHGAELRLRHPVTGDEIGWSLTVAGPDSTVQRRAKLIGAEPIDALAHTVLGWNLEIDGQPVPCTVKTVTRILKAGSWIRDQVDTFAASRAPYGEPHADNG